MSGRYGLTEAGRCRQCGALQFRLQTNGMGRLVEIPAPCPCPKVPPATPAKAKARREWVKSVDRERSRAGVCQRCDLPTVGKTRATLYCAVHLSERRRESRAKHKAKVGQRHQDAFRARHAERLRVKARATYESNATERKRRSEYKRAWRKLSRDKTRLQKERSSLKHFRDPQPGVRRWRAEVTSGLRPANPTRRSRAGNRLCLTPDCRAVMKGRTKKCARCKAVLARQAAEQLGWAA